MDIRGDEGAYEEETPGEVSIETPEADAAEQQRDARRSVSTLRPQLPIDVDPGDAAEQDREVDLDDDEYR
ncbi:hypothetical protein ACTMTI_22680 [Nonomuraea sp. H19]|uniref:hypothetical protein n=1 Tax=Nonomuraea sp. H19 TaxID=3452206 RepID=UPI003F89D90A